MRTGWARVAMAVALGSVLAAAAGASTAVEMGIITGSEKGTYYQFGLNLQQLAKQQSIALAVHPSRGSIENIHAVYERPGVQVGIVQSDVLAFVTRVQTDPVLQRIARKTKMVFPLYNEEVHLLGRAGLASFDDLAGKRVAIGREGSGTYLTARLLFNVSEVAPAEMVPIDTEEALAALKAGRVDAMFYVAGVPVRLLAEGVSERDGLALVPITNKSITEFYPVASIPAGTYAWQTRPVEVVAVKSVLVSFDYRRRDCDSVGKLAKTVADGLPWLVKHGHPKWKSVDLDYPLRGWDQYDCVRKYLGKAPGAARPARSAASNPVMDAIKQALDN
jgi:TRAP transporter TAXI family solute receptor